MTEEDGNGKSKSKARRAGQIVERGKRKQMIRIFAGTFAHCWASNGWLT